MRNRQLRLTMHLLSLILAGFLLSACGGGISGTGDGGIIVAQPDATATADAPNVVTDSNTEDVQDGDDSDASGSIAGPISSTDQLPTGIDNVVPDLSQIAGTIIQSGSNATNISASLQLAMNLQLISVELQQLQAGVTSNQNLQLTPAASTFFDSTLTLTQADSDSVINLSNDNTLQTVFSTSSGRLLYLFRENQRLTLRRIDLAQNSLFQASLIPLGNATDIVAEAVINNNGDLTIIRSLATTESTVTFADHPTDTTVPSQREIINTDGTTLVLETCTRATAANSCLLDSDWTATTSTEDTATGSIFSQASAVIEMQLATIESPLDTLPVGVISAAIASTEDDQAVVDNLQCGLQVFMQTLRPFCIQPQPFELEGTVFQETLSGGQIFYQQLP